MKFTQTIFFAIFTIAIINSSFAQSTLADTTTEKLIMNVFEKNLSRAQQLAVLDKALGEQFDLSYELRMLLQSMSDEERQEVMKYVYLKAKKPMPAKGPVAKIYWKDVEHNFGTVKRGQVVKHIFEFTNIGKLPYEITDVEASCGCTIADYTGGIIPPGGKGSIEVQFNSDGKSGENTELVTVVGNSYPNRVVLVINANVK